MEVWKPIKGYEGKYEVSNIGRVRTLHYYGGNRTVVMKQSTRRDGYASVGLSRNNVVKTYLIHRLVAEAFIKNPDNLEMVNHKDENKSNNTVENLEWCTRSYNQVYSMNLHPERRKIFGENFKDKSTGKNLSPMTKHIPRKYFMRIEQRTLDDELIKVFDSFSEARKETGLPTGNIKAVCDRNKEASRTEKKTHKNYISRCGNYIWRYAE